MAKVTFASDITSISGKLCSKEGVVYSVNQRTGKTYRSDRHGFTDKNSAEQQTVRNLFKKKSAAATTWWNANKEIVNKKTKAVTQEATEDMLLLLSKYKAQDKIGNPYSYFRSLVDDNLKVHLGTKTIQLAVPDDTTDTTNPSSTGGTSGTSGTTNPPSTDFEE